MMARIAALALIALCTACSGKSAPVTADGLEVSLPRPGTEMGAAYLVLTNTTPDAITITAVSSPQFAAVEMHESVISDGISRMQKLDSVIIPAHGSVTFERGGKHLMLMRPTGDIEDVSLAFNAGTVPVLAITVSVAE